MNAIIIRFILKTLLYYKNPGYVGVQTTSSPIFAKCLMHLRPLVRPPAPLKAGFEVYKVFLAFQFYTKPADFVSLGQQLGKPLGLEFWIQH